MTRIRLPLKLRPVDKLHFQMMAARLDYVREHRFHPARKWRFDFAFLRELVAVEVQGGIHIQGGHTRGAGYRSNREKINEAQLLGWLVLEVTDTHIANGKAWEWIMTALRQRKSLV